MNFARLSVVILLSYQVVLVLLLLSELGVPGLDFLRATDRVLLLLGLAVLPFILLTLASSKAIRSLSLKLSGQELNIELGELRDNVELELGRIKGDFSGRVSISEQALWPILAGEDIDASKRWAASHLKIGSKLDVSHLFFSHLLAEHIARSVSGVECELCIPSGGLKNFADLRYRRVDMYVEFTGTGCQLFGVDLRGVGVNRVIKELNRRSLDKGIQWLRPLGASENYCIVMTKEKATDLGVKSISDLTRVSSELVFSGDPEFLNRHDGYIGLSNAYNLRFRSTEICNINNRYALFESGQADVFVGYETDPQLVNSSKLIVLDDSENFFPDYYAVPLIRREPLGQIEGLEKALLSLHNVMTTRELVDIVFEIDRRTSDPAVAKDIARKFLDSKRPPKI